MTEKLSNNIHPLRTSDFNEVQFVLLDIEGTTSDILFVKNVLFPYSARELRNFISQNKMNPKVRDALKEVGAANDELAIQQLLTWINDDVKHPALKTLQGMIWRGGFEGKVFQAHIYPDVLPAWQKWLAGGLSLGIYSSGSVDAQKLYFQYTTAGNVLHYLSAHFDLAIGSKRESKSFLQIAQKLNKPANKILFLSDIEAELDAAKCAQFLTAQIVRPGTEMSSRHIHFENFSDI